MNVLACFIFLRDREKEKENKKDNKKCTKDDNYNQTE